MANKKQPKKYELIKNDNIKLDGRILYRIKAIRDVVDSDGNLIVIKGDLGGFVQDESNLSHKGSCWIYDDAACYGGGRVYDDAIVCDRARIHGCAKLYDKVIARDNADISGDARLFDKIMVRDRAHISGKTLLQGSYSIDYNIPHKDGWNDA